MHGQRPDRFIIMLRSAAAFGIEPSHPVDAILHVLCEAAMGGAAGTRDFRAERRERTSHFWMRHVLGTQVGLCDRLQTIRRGYVGDRLRQPLERLAVRLIECFAQQIVL